MMPAKAGGAPMKKCDRYKFASVRKRGLAVIDTIINVTVFPCGMQVV
jgi:hypothetical protein